MTQGSVQDLVARLRSGLSGARRDAPAESPGLRLQEGDLRHVAILFLDVRGFTGLAEQLAPDELSLFIHQTVFQAFAQAIADHSGVVLQFLGDAIYALFPPALARIDPREMAARAAWTILGQVEAIEPICREANLRLEVRIGLNYGKIALSRVRVGDRLEWTGAGDAINVAKRLETAAPGNSALVLPDFARALEDRFTFQSIGVHALKGKGAHELFMLGPPHADLVQTASAPRVPLVGRERELRELPEALGHGRGVALVGEAGVGKSRLLDEAITDLRELAVARAQCVPYGRRLYGPLGGWLRGVLRKLGQHELSQCLEWPLEPALAQELAEALPVLERTFQPEAAGESDPQAAALRVKLAFLAFFRAAAAMFAKRGQGLVLRIEDVQWLDEGSAGVIQFAAASDPGLKLVMTSRAAVSFMACDRVWQVPPLSSEESAELLRRLLGGPVEAATERVFVERSAGNPFALGELVTEALRQGGLSQERAGWTLSEEGRGLLPDSLEGAVLARVDGLSPGLKELLQKASVLGREFSRPHLAYVHQRSGGGDLDRALGALERDGFLTRVSRSRIGFADHGEVWTFCNGLVQEAIEASLLAQNRRTLHRLALEALEADGRQAPGRLAYHAEAAEDWGRALAYNYREATLAFEGSNFRAGLEALEAAERALASLENRADFRRAELDLLLLKADLLEKTSRYDEALEAAHAGLAETGDVPELAAEFEARVGLVLLRKSRLEEAAEMLRRCLARGELSPRLLSEVRYALGSVAYDRGRYEEAEQEFQLAWHAATAGAETGRMALALRSLAFVDLAQGRVPSAVERFQQALKLARAARNVRLEGNLVGSLGLAQVRQRDYAGACSAFEVALECARRCLATANEAVWLVNLGAARLRLEQWEEARACLEEGRRLGEEAGYATAVLEARVELARLSLRRGDLARARQEAREAALEAASVGSLVLEGHARLLLAEVGDRLEDPELSLQRQRALLLAQRTGDAGLLAELG